jgi:hypothetical protein
LLFIHGIYSIAITLRREDHAGTAAHSIETGRRIRTARPRREDRQREVPATPLFPAINVLLSQIPLN